MAEATIEEFIEKLLDGATLAAHPDTLADAMSRTDSVLWPLFNSAPKIPNRYLVAGRLFAMKVPSREEILARWSNPVWSRDIVRDFIRPHYHVETLYNFTA